VGAGLQAHVQPPRRAVGEVIFATGQIT
jgi:hypothetical protein